MRRHEPLRSWSATSGHVLAPASPNGTTSRVAWSASTSAFLAMDEMAFLPWGRPSRGPGRISRAMDEAALGVAKVTPHMLGALPGMTGFATKMMRGQIADLDVPTVPEMLDQISAAGGHLWACRMSFDMMKLSISDLYDGIDAVISANDFIEMTDGAQLLFI